MKLSTLFLTTAACAMMVSPAFAKPGEAAPEKIQVALLLDTSNSMDGLISQAKSQLWTLVNELSEGEKNGQAPEIELALYEYGNSNLSVSKGYIRQVLPLSSDLDAVSEKLFALSTDGGEEYAGMVIKTAIDELKWSDDADDMKLIIVAGNEPFTQGPINYQSACARAQKGGIMIDTIHCGSEEQGIKGKWKAGAECGGGIYMVINQDEETVHVASPYDDQLLDLNKKLNKTYIGYGAEGEARKMRQETQDSNAASMSVGSLLKRSKSKASAQYKNESWDIVDAYEADEEAILELDDKALPKEMKGMDKNARMAFVEKKTQERKAIQAEIKSLEEKRTAFVSEKRKEMADTKTLDNVMVSAVRKQARENGYEFKK